MNPFVFAVEVCANCGEQVDFNADGYWEACDKCGSDKTTEVRFRVDRSQLLKQVKPRQALIEATVYFGCWQQVGHYYWLRGMWKASGFAARYDGLTPWGASVDGGLFAKGTGPRGEGVAAIVHKDGWTAFAFEDRSVDTRGGSWSIYCIPEVLGWHDALSVAREAFPEVFARYTFPIVQHAPL